VLLAAASAALVVEAFAWGWSRYLRAARVSDFAFGGLPAWPFMTYVLLTIGGIALLAFALLAREFRPWLGRVTQPARRSRVQPAPTRNQRLAQAFPR
jgi:hypothetical protein